MSTDGQDRAVVDRRYLGEKDYWRIRQLLADTYRSTPLSLNWEVRRWDGWFWENADTGPVRRIPQKDVRLWETSDGTLVGAVFGEAPGDAHLQIHPEFRHLDAIMLTWAERHLSRDGGAGDGRRSLVVTAFDNDEARKALLLGRGYHPVWPHVTRRMRLDLSHLPETRDVAGYRIRSLRPNDTVDYRRIGDLLNAAFERSTHSVEWFAALTRAPSFRFDLQLVAEASDGSFAAHAALNVDEANQRGILEPVCTHPGHRHKGLASVVITEAIRRMAAFGVTEFHVEATSVAANDLYRRAGFTEAYAGSDYRRILDEPHA